MSASIRTDRWVRRATVATVALALVTAILGIGVHRTHAAEHRRQEARAVGARSVVAVLSYRPSTIRQEVRRERKLLGQPFADDFTQLVRDVIAPKAEKRGIRTRATVVANGVSSAHGNTVVLLMFVNVVTTDRTSTEPAVSGSRLRVTMSRNGGRWRIVGLDPV